MIFRRPFLRLLNLPLCVSFSLLQMFLSGKFINSISKTHSSMESSMKQYISTNLLYSSTRSILTMCANLIRCCMVINRPHEPGSTGFVHFLLLKDSFVVEHIHLCSSTTLGTKCLFYFFMLMICWSLGVVFRW